MIKIWNLVQGTSPWILKKLRSGWRDESDPAAMDQINTLPKEILSMIFENLDLGSLKEARLVSKRWHGEAEFHMKAKGIVSLYTEKTDHFSRIAKFLSLREEAEKSGTLPDPFLDIELDLGRVPSTLPSEQQLNKLTTSLPLVLTRFSAGRLPLKLTFPILLNASSTLEYLALDAGSSREGYKPPGHPQQLFPKLRTVNLERSSEPDRASWTHFSSTVAWVVNGSPNLEKFYSLLLRESPIEAFQQLVNQNPLDAAQEILVEDPEEDAEELLEMEDDLNALQELLNADQLQHFQQLLNMNPFHAMQELLQGNLGEVVREFGSELLLQLDLKTLKTLKISLHRLNDAARVHLLATPFSRLQHLKLFRISSNLGAVAGIVNTTRATLKTLTLLGNGSVVSLADHGFPVCPSMEALTLRYFPDEERYSQSLQFLSHRFPRLQELNILVLKTSDSIVWGGVSSFSSVKTLRIARVLPDFAGGQSPGDEYLFLRNFPDLETLDIGHDVLITFCTPKATGDPEVARLLEGVKYLRLGEADFGNPDFSCVSVLLRGLETISLDSSEGITTLRVKDMPRLKMIRFPWDRNDLNLRELLKMARSVEKVAITNCCSLPGSVDERSKELLNKFFQSARNTVCGCQEMKQSLFQWF